MGTAVRGAAVGDMAVMIQPGGNLRLARAALDGDPDGDPVDAAGMPGRTEDQGVGPGGDPERFGDLVEQ